jgi:hypothetical protein
LFQHLRVPCIDRARVKCEVSTGEVIVATIRKYVPRKAPKKAFFSVDRTLLAGVIGFGAIGLAQPTLVSLASNDRNTPVVAQNQPKAAPPAVAGKPAADYTPVGSIEKATGETSKPVEKPVANPLGLRLER